METPDQDESDMWPVGVDIQERTGLSCDGRPPSQWCGKSAEGCGEPCVRKIGHVGECHCGCGKSY